MLSSPIQSSGGMSDADIKHAINLIYSTYGDRVSVDAKRKDLVKFGRNPAADTSAQTVWNQGGNETYVSTNAIDSISSSSTSDTGTVSIEGHTISGSDLTFVVQSKTLTGQTKATLDTPLARCTRVYNTGTADFVGDIVPSNHDVRMICTADTGSTDVSASISGILAKVIS